MYNVAENGGFYAAGERKGRFYELRIHIGIHTLRPVAGQKPGLARTQALLEHLGHPERRLKFVHIGGTNGKGSTAALVESVLRQAGYRTGLYTSPYLNRFNEQASGWTGRR